MKLCNEYLSAEFSLENAEVVSLKKAGSDFEIMWNRDKTYWGNANPILFPWISEGWGYEYQYDGKNYRMGNHGFARHSLFTCVKADENEVELELRDNEEILAKEYPFHFRLSVKYSLEGKKLWLRYKVENLDNKPIPFMIGFHPAFRVPMSDDSKLEDYYLKFEKEEDLTKNMGAPETDFGVTDTIKGMDKKPFNGTGAVFFSNPVSEYVDMTDGKNGIRVGIKNFRSLGFWRKTTDFPIICIEPQNGHGFSKENNDDIPENNTLSLPAGECYETSYYWEVL